MVYLEHKASSMNESIELLKAKIIPKTFFFDLVIHFFNWE